jgi:hypothetical protein
MRLALYLWAVLPLFSHLFAPMAPTEQFLQPWYS